MKTVKVTARQSEVLRALTPRDVRTLRKYPNLLREGKHLIKACKKVIAQLEALQPYTNARKRQTAYKRMVKACSRAVERLES